MRQLFAGVKSEISVAEKSTSVGPQAIGTPRQATDYAHAHARIVCIGRPPRV
jgi:hypothetical protein